MTNDKRFGPEKLTRLAKSSKNKNYYYYYSLGHQKFVPTKRHVIFKLKIKVQSIEGVAKRPLS